MGLTDKAITALEGKIEYITEHHFKARIANELANCQIELGNYTLAYETLNKTVENIKAGTLAHEVILKLAEVCLELKRNSQSVSLCTQLLDLSPSEQVKTHTLELMAKAYSRQKNYDKAALTLMGQWQ